jgi:hypothetical protein
MYALPPPPHLGILRLYQLVVFVDNLLILRVPLQARFKIRLFAFVRRPEVNKLQAAPQVSVFVLLYQ